MAARKKRALTHEEQLEAALVPEDEWPYELPDNWCWTRLGNAAQYINGRAFKPAEWEDEGRVIIRIQNLTESTTIVNRTTKQFEEKYLVRDGDLLFAWSASLGAHFWSGEDGWLNQHIFKVIPHEGVDKLYLYYFLVDVVDQLYAKTHGSGMVHITLKPFIATPMPLPPLCEQRRIASRIERLFAKLNDAEAELREVIDSSEQRQAAILHNAFSGELTVQGDDSDQVWPRVMVGTIASGLKYGTSEKSTYENNGMPVLRIPNVSSSHVDLGDMKYLSHSDVKPSDTLQEGDILMIRSNGSRDLVGRCAVVPALDKAYAYASFLIRIRPSDKVDPHYLWYYLQSPDAKAQLFTKAKSSSGIHNINSKEIGATIMPLPSLGTQHEVVRMLDAFFDSENKARSEATDALDAIRMTRESILSKALRGELGTNNPAEPSSKELLASIVGGNACK
ncbi:MAG: restriction endonuclease subunit S [Eggerthellaceae bacterium]|nr:restriction endonuclease subunit S [Eggerthellaceae bacterium]